jgi:hypothetical protein
MSHFENSTFQALNIIANRFGRGFGAFVVVLYVAVTLTT